MYCIKVEEGRERISVRKYASAFIPSYTSAQESAMGKRLFVVPGYIFLMKRGGSAEKVPDADWKVIEALADPRLSTLDVSSQQIVDGPLKGLLILRINPALKSVCIRAKLLGETRDYWLAVRFGTAAADDRETAAEMNQQNQNQQNKQSRQSKTAEENNMAKAYTEEQLQGAIERAKEIGIHAAGKEVHIPWQAIMAAAKKAGVEIVPKQLNKQQEAKKQARIAAAAEKAEKTEKAEKSAKTKKAGRPAKVEKPVKAEKAEKAPKSPRTKKAEAEVKAANPAEDKPTAAMALKVENAVLRAENAKLKEQVAKLTKALHELL